MKFVVATYHVPHPQGAAAGRQLWALAEALRADGHAVRGWCWGPGGATLPMPDWCRWSRQRGPQGLPRVQTLLRPRAAAAGISSLLAADAGAFDDDTVWWADDWASWPAVARAGDRSLLSVHYDVGLDARTLGWSAGRVQDWRAQRRAVRQAGTVVALSHAVAARVAAAATVPATLPVPDEALPLRDEPVALMFADWSWPANVVALKELLAQWPAVRERVPAAEILVAGRGSADIGAADGVRVLGEVTTTVDAMSEASVLAFPCPPTSGPKMKVLDALGAGLPVVTTPPGVEGMSVPADAVAVASTASYADALAAVLADPERRHGMAQTARGAVLAHHAPAVAARARVAAVSVSR